MIMISYRLSGLMLGLLLAPRVVAQPMTVDSDFTDLKQQLNQFNFQVLIAPPPRRGAYGLLNATRRTIWIHPLTFELGIASPVLVHEAVHAAQTCKGEGQLVPLELTLEPLIYARPFWMRYGDIHRQDLEREAFTIQTQPNRFDLITSLLKSYC
ncbi:MAG: hypothetical protein ACO36E_07830 [Synechocystis sp.]